MFGFFFFFSYNIFSLLEVLVANEEKNPDEWLKTFGIFNSVLSKNHDELLVYFTAGNLSNR